MKLTADEFVKKRTEAYMAAFTGEEVLIENTRYPNAVFELKCKKEPFLDGPKNEVNDDER